MGNVVRELEPQTQGPPAARAPAAWQQARGRPALLLGCLLIGTLLKGVLWSQLVFPLDAPDEPSHFNYVMQIHANHALPQVFMTAPGSMNDASTPQDPETRAMLDYYGFTQYRGMPYESVQPPLYYTAGALLISPLGEDRLMLMYAVRLLSVLFGVGAVWAAWWGVRALWPDVPLVVWGVPLALTLQPQFTFSTSTITNDAAVIFFGTLLFAVWAGGLRASLDGHASLWLWGLLAGAVTSLGILSKFTMIATLPVTLLWLWWLAASGRVVLQSRIWQFALGAVSVGVAGLVLAGWWVVRNLLVYGEPTGSRASFALYRNIYWTRQHIPLDQPFSGFSPVDFAEKTFPSFWAIYGWLAVMLEWWTYAALLVLSLAAVGGLARGWFLRDRHGEGLPGARLKFAWLLVAASIFALLSMLSYDSFVDYQPQGRYLFVALVPILALLVLGLSRVTARPAINTALVWAFLGVLALMQVLSVPALLDRWAAMAF